jgi:hypothetical protein
MSKTFIHFNDYVSLAVMLLMVVAFVAGQADASAYAAEKAMSLEPVATFEAMSDDRLKINFDGHLGDEALKISIAVVTDLRHFRGEDE